MHACNDTIKLVDGIERILNWHVFKWKLWKKCYVQIVKLNTSSDTMSLSVYTLQSTWTTVWKQPHTLRWQDNASSCTKCAMLEFTLDILSSSNTLSARGSCKLVGVDHWRVLVSNILYLPDRHTYYLYQIHCPHMQVSSYTTRITCRHYLYNMFTNASRSLWRMVVSG